MKISVIIPTLNNSQSIATRLAHIFKQTIPPADFEVLVVDNGSVDNTVEVLTLLCKQYGNLRWCSEPIQGRPQARNRGIHESTGDLILFLDDDIDVASDHLERHLVHHSAASKPITVLGHISDISSMRPKWLQDYFHARQSIVSSRVTGSNLTIPRGIHFITGNVSLLRNTLEMVKQSDHAGDVYFDPLFAFREDADLGLRLAKAGVEFIFANDIQCLHNHKRNVQAIWIRSYQVGYSTERLIRKHPEVATTARYLTKSVWANLMFLVLSVSLFVPAYILHFFWSEPLYKVIGGILLYQTNRGYQQASKDHCNV